MPTDSYQARTEQNVIGADGTVIISHGKLSGGSAYAQKVANKHNRLCLHIDLNERDILPAVLEILNWLNANGIKVLNVAGPRASKDPKIYKVVKEILESLLILNASVDRIFSSLLSARPPTTRTSGSQRQSMRLWAD